MKQKFKKFFTLDHRKSDGFTLVELIVVIAILATLAGASVPAYNLYVKKARESADEQILAAVNSAFASACIENKVDVKNVSDAKISVIDNSVQSISDVTLDDETIFADGNAKEDFVSGVLMSFDRLYTQTNENKTFATELVNSLDWEEDGFVISKDFVNAKIVLANGQIVEISAADMKKIQESAFANMGYKGVADAVDKIGDSGETLAALASKLGIMDKFYNVLKVNGLYDGAQNLTNEQMSNGLQMVTAKYLAGATDEDIANLLTTDLGGLTDSSYGMLWPLVGGEGGTKTVSAAALQYAMCESFAQTEAGKSQKFKGTQSVQVGTEIKTGLFGIQYESPVYETFTYDCNSVSDFLKSDAAKADPIWAIEQVKKTDAYKNGYVSSDPDSQYQKDVNGFVGTMGILGDNLGTTKNPGAVDINGYLQDGVHSSDAENVLTEVLGP